MDATFHSYNLPYSQTGKFSKIALDYVGEAPGLRDFYEHPVSVEGIRSAIVQRQQFSTNRPLLVEKLSQQYMGIPESEKVFANIKALLNENTFTICTAHQPNLFTGHLYFIYKILHIIKLSNNLKETLPEYQFIPVFFMGSEDADLEELNHVVIDGREYKWQTKQTGAVGRMKIDEGLIKLIDQVAGRLLVEKYGEEIIALLKKCYTKGVTIQQATFLFIHELFRDYGLIVLLSDTAAFKNEISAILEADIFAHTSSEIVEGTSEKLSKNYKAQAYPREINLFYLKDDIRNRIVPVGDQFLVHNTEISFTHESIKNELRNYPERFSPNVILRGLFQEFILPDVAWIGGGGELAYWLQLKDLFNQNQVPYPVLVLRNSFLIIEKKYAHLLKKLSLEWCDLFKGEAVLFNDLVKGKGNSDLDLEKEKQAFKELFKIVKERAKAVDVTLLPHTEALETKYLKSLVGLEKKMFRAEKRKFEDQKNQLSKIFTALFPEGGLQERTENFMLFYAKWGKGLFKVIYENSLGLDQEFCVLEEN